MSEFKHIPSRETERCPDCGCGRLHGNHRVIGGDYCIVCKWCMCRSRKARIVLDELRAERE